MSDINLHDHPGLIMLLKEGESLEDFLKLSPEEILIRWVNYHLDKSGCDRQIKNFSGDITDSVAYTHLLYQISPEGQGVGLGPLNVSKNIDMLLLYLLIVLEIRSFQIQISKEMIWTKKCGIFTMKLHTHFHICRIVLNNSHTLFYLAIFGTNN